MKGWKDRPYAEAVVHIARALGSDPVPVKAARVSVTLAVAYAVLDLADAVRDHARSTERTPR